MTNNRFPVESYPFRQNDELFLDANVWLFIYGPENPQNERTAAYSRALQKILCAKSKIYIDVLVVSEFVNTFARTNFKIFPNYHNEFKKFRKSSDFKPIAETIADRIRRILGHCSRIDSGFDLLDIDGLINEYARGDSDLNDQIIVELCLRLGLKLITHDADFQGQKIPIITANKKLLVD